MADDTTRRPTMEARRVSESAADVATQTDEELRPQHQNTSLARARSVGADRQVTRQAPSQDARIAQRSDEVVAPAQQTRKGAPAVRLDMDLDVDINLQARIKGELELSILDSEQASQQRSARQH